MLNKKGFTLVELMATIGILLLMSLIIGANIVSILKSTEELNENNIKEEIEKAACVYVDSSLCNDCYQGNNLIKNKVTIEELYKNGLLPDSKIYVDIKDEQVKISIIDNEKICEY